jgi:mono/diheme cytochrome c family protein
LISFDRLEEPIQMAITFQTFPASAEVKNPATAAPPPYRWKRIALAVAGLAVFPLLMAPGKLAAPAKVVDAEKFVLRDMEGKRRAELSLQAGGPSLALFDERGQRRVQLAVLADGSAKWSLYDQNGQYRATLAVPTQGDPRLDLAKKPNPFPSLPLSAPAAVRPAAPEPSHERMQAAQGLFQQLCATCHGSDGHGRKSLARANIPDFTSATWQAGRTNAQLTASILTGRGERMPSFGDRVRAGQARDLVAFIRTFGPVSVKPVAAPAEDFDTRFRQLQQEYESLQRQLRELHPRPRTP